ncbi:hypothetical protein C8R45DRAFT_1016563 [Mycena sanguinolenta]|nr:hypothetical protein C8R45DRAFT_1016563 [Mycena sanguinolenta]
MAISAVLRFFMQEGGRSESVHGYRSHSAPPSRHRESLFLARPRGSPCLFPTTSSECMAAYVAPPLRPPGHAALGTLAGTPLRTAEREEYDARAQLGLSWYIVLVIGLPDPVLPSRPFLFSPRPDAPGASIEFLMRLPHDRWLRLPAVASHPPRTRRASGPSTIAHGIGPLTLYGPYPIRRQYHLRALFSHRLSRSAHLFALPPNLIPSRLATRYCGGVVLHANFASQNRLG